jgi:hypothetical protein
MELTEDAAQEPKPWARTTPGRPRRNRAVARPVAVMIDVRRLDQPPGFAGRTATLSQRAPVARRIANVKANGDACRAWRVPAAS